MYFNNFRVKNFLHEVNPEKSQRRGRKPKFFSPPTFEVVPTLMLRSWQKSKASRHLLTVVFLAPNFGSVLICSELADGPIIWTYPFSNSKGWQLRNITLPPSAYVYIRCLLDGAKATVNMYCLINYWVHYVHNVADVTHTTIARMHVFIASAW